MSKQHENPPEAIPNGAENLDRTGNVDKIRDILFGSQMRDYDKKFAKLEERLLKESADLRDDLKRRFDSLEAFMKSEVVLLSDGQKAEKNSREESLRAEKTGRDEAMKGLGDKLGETAKNFDRRAAQTEEQSAKAQRDLRQLMLDETKRLADEIAQKHASVAADLGRESQELRGLMTDKYALSDLFAELSLRLKNEFKFPGQ